MIYPAAYKNICSAFEEPLGLCLHSSLLDASCAINEAGVACVTVLVLTTPVDSPADFASLH